MRRLALVDSLNKCPLQAPHLEPYPTRILALHIVEVSQMSSLIEGVRWVNFRLLTRVNRIIVAHGVETVLLG